jgi:hypothetical protein
LEEVLEFDGVRLFVDRAVAVAPFLLTPANANTVTEICRRLDGIPLAIELAAARVKILSVEQINARLQDRFRLLTGGARTAVARQRTLEATVDWSYELLSDAERRLLARLTVFAGGWTLEAAEQVCSDNGIDGALHDGDLQRAGGLFEEAIAARENCGDLGFFCRTLPRCEYSRVATRRRALSLGRHWASATASEIAAALVGACRPLPWSRLRKALRPAPPASTGPPRRCCRASARPVRSR